MWSFFWSSPGHVPAFFLIPTFFFSFSSSLFYFSAFAFCVGWEKGRQDELGHAKFT
jgi:hypothetical protein